MNQAEYKDKAHAWLRQAERSMGRESERNCLMTAQVYATLATIPDPPSSPGGYG